LSCGRGCLELLEAPDQVNALGIVQGARDVGELVHPATDLLHLEHALEDRSAEGRSAAVDRRPVDKASRAGHREPSERADRGIDGDEMRVVWIP
jgi:hypothetical protein